MADSGNAYRVTAWLQWATFVLLLMISPAAGLSNDPHNQRLKGGPDMGGGLPKPSAPTPPGTNNPAPPLAVETEGMLVQALTRQPISGALVVVTDAGGHPVGVDVTDAAGMFTLYLVAKPGLELAVPSEGLAGVEIQAGDSLLIVIP